MRRRPAPATDILQAPVRRTVASSRDHGRAHQSHTPVLFAAPKSAPPLASCATPLRVAHVVVPTVGHRSGRLFQ